MSKVLDELWAWCKERGFDPSDKVELVEFGDLRGRGMKTKQEVKNGEVIFRVPAKWRLSADASLSSTSSSTPSPLTCLELTAITVEKEMRKGLDSSFAPYMRFLNTVVEEKSQNQPILWTEEELLEIKGCTLEGYVGRAEFARRYQDVVHTELKNMGLEIVYDRWLHLNAMVRAYSFLNVSQSPAETLLSPSNPNIAMTPLADALNASISLNNARAFREPSHSNGVENEDDIVVRAVCDIASGAEVYNIFGKLSNGELLRNYGFVESPQFNFPQNPYNEVEIPGVIVKDLVEELLRSWTQVFHVNARKTMSRRDILNDFCDYEDCEQVVFAIGHHGDGHRAFRSLRALLRAVLISDDEILRVITHAEDGETALRSILGRVPIENESALTDALNRISRTRLECFATSLDEDREIMKSEGFENMPLRKRMALIVRTSEKELLKGMEELVKEVGDEEDYEDSEVPEGGEEYVSDSEEEAIDDEEGDGFETTGTAQMNELLAEKNPPDIERQALEKLSAIVEAGNNGNDAAHDGAESQPIDGDEPRDAKKARLSSPRSTP